MKFVVTVRETTDHTITVEATSKATAIIKAGKQWMEDHDSSFDLQIGPRQTFVRKATKREMSVK